MAYSQKTMTAPCDFDSRFVKNLIYKVATIESNFYCVIDRGGTDRLINGKSILGLLSSNIRANDTFTIRIDGATQAQADYDLEYVVGLINGAVV